MITLNRLERRIIGGLGEVPHRGPVAGHRDAGEIEAPALRDEQPESHGRIRLLGIAGLARLPRLRQVAIVARDCDQWLVSRRSRANP